MSVCLICQQDSIDAITWTNLFLPPENSALCPDCQEKLERIQGPICKKCGRKLPETAVCSDCQKWKHNKQFGDALQYNRALFRYTPFMQEIIAQWKYRGDYQLIELFTPYLKQLLFPKQKLTIVPIPLSEQRLYERAFNQSLQLAEKVASCWNLPIVEALARHQFQSEKQSKKSREQRLSTENPFFLSQSLQTDVLLVDDIYTTGMTIHHAAFLLKQAGCQAIYSFTLVR
ncbi:ComF family protein [Gracilibacillus salinarum]|uniref:ComF family protein n=1 Tax=Gracilibacillus salinarum TaxID=2932255 RepID=A0ABY4GLB3_9BACI|nr:ComF family protein [Gracilibacillus salinarum]UOQ85165.1 ComF family protein [Gracilibacillus salinarum]